MTTPENITDYNTLDNTTAGRAIQDGFIFAALSVPDYVPTRPGRFSTITALAAAAGVAFVTMELQARA